jgi:hypothetical protein
LAASLALPTIAVAAEPPDSPAQVALFDSNHLSNIASPVKLDYRFVRQGDPSRSYDDHVVADIKAVHENGGRDVWVSFLSGERQMPTPPVAGFHGNPLLMYFLEHDVLEMRQETGRPAAYFRNRIRRAFFDGAQTQAVTIDVSGKAQTATEIDIMPFGHDPNLADLPAVAAKSYRFILCDQVPGTLYQIGSSMPSSADVPAVDETMTFAGEAP